MPLGNTTPGSIIEFEPTKQASPITTFALRVILFPEGVFEEIVGKSIKEDK